MAKDELYRVVTLSDCMQDPATLAWLMQSEVALPGQIPPGRYPTPAEIQSTLDAMTGIRVTPIVSDRVWQVTVASRSDVTWTRLVIDGYTGDLHAAYHFYFEAGWDEMIFAITANLARICGPFVLLHDSGATPQVIM
jgi:hypothetical protein